MTFELLWCESWKQSTMKLALPTYAECFLELQAHISEQQRAVKVLLSSYRRKPAFSDHGTLGWIGGSILSSLGTRQICISEGKYVNLVPPGSLFKPPVPQVQFSRGLPQFDVMLCHSWTCG